jgi:Cu/Zn superoxide dismutase
MAFAIAFISSNEGKRQGHVDFEQLKRGTARVTFQLYGFERGTVHAIHIHEFGDLSRGCESLGGHYNPTHENHGAFGAHPRHKGDLINNFEANDKGAFEFSYIDSLNVRDLYGRSVVIHTLADDLGLGGYQNLATRELHHLCKERGYKMGARRVMVRELNKQSLITGNAGGRIACGIIGRV